MKIASKEWHKNVQKYCSYKQANMLLDIMNGPIADSEDVELAKDNKKRWEDVRIYRNKDEIEKI